MDINKQSAKRKNAKAFHNDEHSTQQLSPGTPVRFRVDNKWRRGNIKSTEGPQRYKIKTLDGKEFIRNRRQLFPRKRVKQDKPLLYLADQTNESDQAKQDQTNIQAHVEDVTAHPIQSEGQIIPHQPIPNERCTGISRYGRKIIFPKRYGF